MSSEQDQLATATRAFFEDWLAQHWPQARDDLAHLMAPGPPDPIIRERCLWFIHDLAGTASVAGFPRTAAIARTISAKARAAQHPLWDRPDPSLDSLCRTLAALLDGRNAPNAEAEAATLFNRLAEQLGEDWAPPADCRNPQARL